MMAAKRAGVLLVNVGTPESPEVGPVRRYLREFLSDPRVLDINPVGRFLLLEGVILPFRPRRSAAAYRQIWTPEGSPLRVHGEALARGLAGALGGAQVELGMQYGSPSIPAALERLKEADRLVVVPLYPQYSASSTGAALEQVFGVLGGRWVVPAVATLAPFFDRPEMLDAFAAVARPVLEEARPDHLLFSFHGLPERHMRKADRSGSHCLRSDDCCSAPGSVNRDCYRAQCFATAGMLAERLGRLAERHSVSFQSRLGRTPWIRPFTDLVLPELAQRGVKRVAVMCPAFVADCLETLEEIGIRARRDFKAAGGEELVLVPSLNAHPAWVSGLARLVAPLLGPVQPPA